MSQAKGKFLSCPSKQGEPISAVALLGPLLWQLLRWWEVFLHILSRALHTLGLRYFTSL